MNRHFRCFSGVLSLLTVLFFASTGLAAKPNVTDGDAPAVQEIKITANQNAFEPSRIEVHKGAPVRLIVTSVDVDTNLGIQEFGIDLKIKKGTTETVEFTPTKLGTFTFFSPAAGNDAAPAMTGELTVTDETAKAASGMKVTFDPNNPGVVYVEANGERVRIDTNARAYARVENPPVDNGPSADTQPATVATNKSPVQTPDPAPRANEAYDYQVVTIPTPKRVRKSSLNVHFTHRFSSTITGQGQDFEDVASNLAGLDSFSVSALGFSYGFTDRLYGKILRSPICDSAALCKTIEMGVGYHLLDEAGKSPVALSVYGSIEGNDNFTDSFVYNAQVMIARSITDYVNVFFSPAVHFKTNGYGRFNPRPGRFFNDEAIARDFSLGEHTGSFGFGVNARITQGTSLLFDYTPRVGFKLGRVEPVFDANFNLVGYENKTFSNIGFGIEKRMGRHAFALTFTNSQTTTTGRYNSSNLALPRDRFVIGFNLYRRLL